MATTMCLSTTWCTTSARRPTTAGRSTRAEIRPAGATWSATTSGTTSAVRGTRQRGRLLRRRGWRRYGVRQRVLPLRRSGQGAVRDGVLTRRARQPGGEQHLHRVQTGTRLGAVGRRPLETGSRGGRGLRVADSAAQGGRNHQAAVY